MSLKSLYIPWNIITELFPFTLFWLYCPFLQSSAFHTIALNNALCNCLVQSPSHNNVIIYYIMWFLVLYTLIMSFQSRLFCHSSGITIWIRIFKRSWYPECYLCCPSLVWPVLYLTRYNTTTLITAEKNRVITGITVVVFSFCYILALFLLKVYIFWQNALHLLLVDSLLVLKTCGLHIEICFMILTLASLIS